MCSKELNNDDQLGVKTLKRWEITDLDNPWKPGRKITIVQILSQLKLCLCANNTLSDGRWL